MNKLTMTDKEARDILSDEVVRLHKQVKELRDVLHYVESNLDYLARLWGREGVTQNVIDRVKQALKDE